MSDNSEESDSDEDENDYNCKHEESMLLNLITLALMKI